MKKILTALIATVMLSGCTNSSEVPGITSLVEGTPVTANENMGADFVYELIDDEIAIYYSDMKSESIIIPAEIDNYPVKTAKILLLNDCVTEITYSEGITEITFPQGKSLEIINLPSTLNTLSFKNNNFINTITEVNISDNNIYSSNDGVLFTADKKTLVYYPSGRKGSYTIPDGTEFIGENAFWRSQIEYVKFPESVTEIGISAFEDCENLISFSSPKSLRKIGEDAFYYSGLIKVNLSEGLEEIESYAFSQTSLSELILPSSLISTGNNICGDNKSQICIYANAPSAGLESLNIYNNLFYLNETVLERAIRLGKKYVEQRSIYNSIETAIFTDIDGDNFPELFISNSWHEQYCMKYSEETGWNDYLNVSNAELTQSDISIYYDKENDSYFFVSIGVSIICDYYLYAYKTTIDNNGQKVDMMIGNSGVFYSIFSNNERVGGVCCYNSIGGFNIHEYTNDGSQEDNIDYLVLKELVENGLSEYVFIKKLDFDALLNQYQSETTNNNSYQIYYDGEFSERPSDSIYNFKAPESEVLFSIGDCEYTKDSYSARLTAEDICPENFEKLAQLPKLNSLYIQTHAEADLTGIEKLTGLKHLFIAAESVAGTDCLIQLNWLEWIELTPMDNIDFLSYMDNVKILEIFNTLNKPDDYFNPVYDMESLKYMPVSLWEISISQEQVSAIKENRPDVKICPYKVG